MIRPIALLSVLAAFSTAACAGASADDTEASAGAITARGSHHEKVLACEKTNKAAANEAMSTVAMVEAEVDYATCLETANDQAVPAIEGILKENDSASAGGVKAALDAARAGSATLCEELYKASENFGGSLQRVESAGCTAERERFLAAIIDDMVAFTDQGIVYIPDGKGAHAACYKTYEAAPGESTAEMVMANGDLIDCVKKETAPLADAMAATQIENDSAAGPLAKAKTRVAAAVEGKATSAAGLCGALAEAGENGIGTLSRVSAAACAVRATEDVFNTLKR